jgi:hypothetical protein
MPGFARVARKVLGVGGWAPLLVFATHVVAAEVIDVYSGWPRLDVPMHVAGGVAIAYFLSGCFQALPHDRIRRSLMIVLEALLIASLTTTAAVVWELIEFAVDAITGSNLQVSLTNTMQDLALGMLGAAAVVVARVWKTGASSADVSAVAGEWMTGRVA